MRGLLMASRIRFYRPRRRRDRASSVSTPNHGQKNDRHQNGLISRPVRPHPGPAGGDGTRGRPAGSSQAKRRGTGDVDMGFKVAVVGATGNVGREMLNILAERGFPADEVVALASRAQPGHRSVLRRPDAEGQGARHLRLFRHRHLPDVGRRQRLQGMVAEDRRAGLPSSSIIRRPGATIPTCRWSCRR